VAKAAKYFFTSSNELVDGGSSSSTAMQGLWQWCHGQGLQQFQPQAGTTALATAVAAQ